MEFDRQLLWYMMTPIFIRNFFGWLVSGLSTLPDNPGDSRF